MNIPCSQFLALSLKIHEVLVEIGKASRFQKLHHEAARISDVVAWDFARASSTWFFHTFQQHLYHTDTIDVSWCFQNVLTLFSVPPYYAVSETDHRLSLIVFVKKMWMMTSAIHFPRVPLQGQQASICFPYQRYVHGNHYQTTSSGDAWTLTKIQDFETPTQENMRLNQQSILSAPSFGKKNMSAKTPTSAVFEPFLL